MKDIKQLLTELENIGVFKIEDKQYISTGYNVDITVMFTDLHQNLSLIRGKHEISEVSKSISKFQQLVKDKMENI